MSMTKTTLDKRTYVRVNQKFLEKFGYTEEDIVGKTSVEFGILDANESQRVRSLISEKGRLQNDYVKCITKSGEIVHTLSSIEYIEINNETHLISFFVDITEIVKQQGVIEKHAQQLEALNKELEAFSYSVSHDLRAPLRAIDGYVNILEEDFAPKIDEDAKRLLASVSRNAKKMGVLIDSLLDFARLGRRPISRSDIDMNLLVQEVLAELNTTVDFKTEIRAGDLHHINGDLALIKQVMVNLIANGIKYSSKKEHPLVEISSALEGENVVVTVTDNGAGFDMAYAEKLFGVFQRLHTVSEFEGTGVGLAMVQRIINKHGGTIHAEAELGKGAKFWFTMPAK
jgi:PAS domain S-box-containing protein